VSDTEKALKVGLVVGRHDGPGVVGLRPRAVAV